jgi:hypothetical protein
VTPATTPALAEVEADAEADPLTEVEADGDAEALSGTSPQSLCAACDTQKPWTPPGPFGALCATPDT